MTIATEAQKRGACPQCGAKLPDVPVSLCPYCATPLETRADREAKTSVHAARIGKIRDHKDMGDAVAWAPPEGAAYQHGQRLTWWGTRCLVVGGLVAAGVAATQGAGMFRTPALWLGAATAILGGWLLARGRSSIAAALRYPLMKRPALILDRRSETRIHGWSGATTYYFKLEFEDGAQGEFGFPGLGAQEEPYSTNLPGVAYTRGQDLLYFRHVRV